MLSSELEFCLNQAFREARTRRHEFLTVEQLLLGGKVKMPLSAMTFKQAERSEDAGAMQKCLGI